MTMTMIIWNQIKPYDRTIDAVSDRTLGLARISAIGDVAPFVGRCEIRNLYDSVEEFGRLN